MTRQSDIAVIDELLGVADSGEPPVTWPFDAAMSWSPFLPTVVCERWCCAC